jgi:GST-like protein
MTVELYAWDTPNGRKISIALEEMGLPYNVHSVDISKGEQFSPDYLAFSPNNRIPAIIDPEGYHGRTTVFESGAILLYLAEKTGQFLASSGPERIAAWEWLMWQMGGFGPMPGQVHHFLTVKDEAARRYGLERYKKETLRLYGVADQRLSKVEFFAGSISVADFAILGWAWRHERHEVDLAEFPNVKRWFETMMARPGVQRGLSVDLKTKR